MPYKHQTESYRSGGEWTCWMDAGSVEYAAHVVADIKNQGFPAKREKDRVFIKAAHESEIDPYHENRLAP